MDKNVLYTIKEYSYSLANNLLLEKDIDELYKKNSRKYYNSFKKYDLDKCYYYTCGSIKTRINFMKISGILANDINADLEPIFKLFIKGFKRLYNLFKRNVSDKGIYDYFYSDLKNVSLLEYNINIIAFLFFCLYYDRTTSEFYNSVFEKIRTMTINLEYNLLTSFSGIEKDIKDKKLFKEKQQIILKKIDKDFDPLLSYLPFVELGTNEGISLADLLANIEFNKKDLIEVVNTKVAIDITDGGKKIDSDQMFVAGATIIKMMCKLYVETEKLYQENCKENLFDTIEKMEQQINLYKIEISELKKTNSLIKDREKEIIQLKRKIEDLEKKNEKLCNLINTAEEKFKENSKELQKLREFVYNTNEDIEIDDIKTENKTNKIIDKNIIILGGHPNWIAKMKLKAPNWTYIGVDISKIELNIFNTADLVIINTDFIKHSIYYKIIDYFRNNNINFNYINNIKNVDITFNSIYKMFYQ